MLWDTYNVLYCVKFIYLHRNMKSNCHFLLTLAILLVLRTNHAFSQSITNTRFVEDDPIMAVLDSLNTLKFFSNSAFTTDRAILNIYKFPPDSVPRYDDFVLQYRLSKLNAKSPFKIVFNDAVKQYVDAYSIRKRELVPRLLGLAQQYFPLFEEQLDKYDLPLELKYLAVIESALNPLATSKSGAKGLWQFMYPTGKMFNLDVTSFTDQRCDPYLSTVAACQYFKYLYDMFGNWELVLAAYNGGPGTVNKAIRRAGGKMNYWEIRPYLPEETQGYVPAFFAATYIMNYASEHNLYPLKPKIFHYEMDTVVVKERVTFEALARSLEMDVEDIQYFNPMYRRKVIPSPNPNSEPYTLILPIAKIGKFLSNEIAIYDFSKELDNSAGVREFESVEVLKYHKVKRGETLTRIASRYHCTVYDLRSWNNLKSNAQAVAGRTLKVYVTKEVPKKSETELATKSPEAVEEVVEKKLAENLSKPQSIKTYTVKKGDTLFKIATENGMTLDELLRLNGLSRKSTITIGQRIKIG